MILQLGDIQFSTWPRWLDEPHQCQAKSLRLVYLLMLAVLPYKVQIVTDLRSVKAEQQQLASLSLE